jgi:Domain of unknown function (DUF1906)
VDSAFDRPSVAGLVAAGKQFACRYVGPGSAGTHLDPPEAHALSAAGITIVANAEGAGDGLLGGFAVGQSWAQSAHAQAVACGMPADRPIYLSVDFDVTSAQWPAVRDALHGATAVLGLNRVGVYGGYNAVVWAVRDNAARWFWQTFAWSDGRWHPAAHIQQYRTRVALAGGTVDLNRSMNPDVGQWQIGDEDMADVYYRIQSSDPEWNGSVFVFNRVHRRGPIRGPGEIREAALSGAREFVLTDGMRRGVGPNETWDSFLTAVAGPPFPAQPNASGLVPHTHEVPATGPAVSSG